MKPDAPIAVFDSGLGGLTVAAAIHRLMPKENLVFLADRARVPYASLSPNLISKFASECLEFLLAREPKAVVIACNTVSAVALELLEHSTNVPVLGVIAPTAMAAADATRTGRVGVLATTATVKRLAYESAIAELNPLIKVFANGCPLLVPLVEEGWTEGEIPQKIVEHYAEPVLKMDIDTLVLGCTHYEYFRPHFQYVFGSEVTLVNTPEVTALALSQILESSGEITSSGTSCAVQIFSTDVSDALVRVVSQLFADLPPPQLAVDSAQIPFAKAANGVRETYSSR